MEKFIYLYLLLFVLGCSSPLESKMYDYGEEFELDLEEKAFFKEGNVTVTFLDVITDSRCPKNVTCVWAGNGEVEIQVNHQKIRLNTYLEPHQVLVSDVRVELVSLQPYPEYPRLFDKEDYKVRLLVIRK